MLALGGSARAEVVSGSSSADFIDVGLSLDLLPGVGGGIVVDANISNLVPASGSTPGVYNDVYSLASVGATAGVAPLGLATVADVSTGLVTSTATSNVDGLAGSRFATGVHNIDNLDLSIVDLPLFAPDLISITADAIDVSSTVSGDYGALVATGSLDVTNLVIRVAGTLVATLNGSIAPNTGVALTGALLGTSVILNQQSTTGDGLNSLALTTNAISLDLTAINVAGLGALAGNVTVGPTFASLQAAAVPEPSSAILMSLVGAGGFLVHRRSKRKAALSLES